MLIFFIRFEKFIQQKFLFVHVTKMNEIWYCLLRPKSAKMFETKDSYINTNGVGGKFYKKNIILVFTQRATLIAFSL